MNIFSNICQKKIFPSAMRLGYLIYPNVIVIATGALSLGISQANAVAPTATDIRIGSHADKTRFVIDISDDIKFKIFTLSDPYRVVIDLPEIGWRLPGNVMARTTGVIDKFRYGLFRTGLSRVVLDVKKPVKIKAVFMLPPAKGKRYRLVLDLASTTRAQYLAALRPPTSNPRHLRDPGQIPEASSGILPPGRKPQKTAIEKRVIVIDPGHGGIDPGSTSGRIFEKHITLATARAIKTHLETNGNYKVRLTRKKDSFIRLRRRIAIARAHQAELFISLHADAIRNKRIRGLSVYTLSEKASDKEAAELAEKENKADLIAGMDLSTESKEVTNILIDLAQRETMNESARFAAELVKHIRKVTKTLTNAHRFAGFAVLKAPDVPSILIEMGFLSNRADEQALRSKKYRTNLARAIGSAVEEYFSHKQ